MRGWDYHPWHGEQEAGLAGWGLTSAMNAHATPVVVHDATAKVLGRLPKEYASKRA